MSISSSVSGWCVVASQSILFCLAAWFILEACSGGLVGNKRGRAVTKVIQGMICFGLLSLGVSLWGLIESTRTDISPEQTWESVCIPRGAEVVSVQYLSEDWVLVAFRYKENSVVRVQKYRVEDPTFFTISSD